MKIRLAIPRNRRSDRSTTRATNEETKPDVQLLSQIKHSDRGGPDTGRLGPAGDRRSAHDPLLRSTLSLSGAVGRACRPTELFPKGDFSTPYRPDPEVDALPRETGMLEEQAPVWPWARFAVSG